MDSKYPILDEALCLRCPDYYELEGELSEAFGSGNRVRRRAACLVLTALETSVRGNTGEGVECLADACRNHVVKLGFITLAEAAEVTNPRDLL